MDGAPTARGVRAGGGAPASDSDRDQVYGERFSHQARMLDIQEAVIAPRSPWQNAYAERVIGSIRRQCLGHVVVIGERHLREILSKYVDYYNRTQTHLSLGKDAPEPRSVQPPIPGKGSGGATRRTNKWKAQPAKTSCSEPAAWLRASARRRDRRGAAAHRVARRVPPRE